MRATRSPRQGIGNTCWCCHLCFPCFRPNLCRRGGKLAASATSAARLRCRHGARTGRALRHLREKSQSQFVGIGPSTPGFGRPRHMCREGAQAWNAGFRELRYGRSSWGPVTELTLRVETYMKYPKIGETLSPILLACSFASLLGACGKMSVQHNDWEKARLACADVGIAPGSDVFDQCVFNLYYSLWNLENMER